MSYLPKKLVVDARMLHASGIGTDLQNLLPILKQKYSLVLLGDPAVIKKYEWAHKVEVIPFTNPIYSIAEQLKLPLLVPACDIFLSPHFNVPFLPVRAKQRAVIIHDVYHLASTTINPVQKQYARLLLTAAVKLSDKIITISDFTVSEIRRYLNPGSKPIHKIKLGVDKLQFSSAAITQDMLHEVRLKYKLPAEFILYVGNVKPHKNLVKLVEALALMGEGMQIPLVVVGKKEGFLNGDKNLFKFIEQHHLNHRILFTGFVENLHLPVVYKLASVFVFPSLYEGFGLPPLEAMASGCPTIVSDAASMPEVCKDASYYVNARKPRQIANAIQTVLQNEALKNELVDKGHRLVQEYSWPECGAMLHSILSAETGS